MTLPSNPTSAEVTAGGLLLSICIATLNRGAYIRETLDSIIEQIDARIEVVVLDGGSSDDTEAVMTAMSSMCPQLRYIRNATNQGLDQDYSTAVDACRGDYVWLMTDDDLLKTGAVAAVLAAIADDPSLVVVNAEIRNADLSYILQPRRMSIARDMVFPAGGFDPLFTVAGSYLSFIGCVVLRRSLWREREKAAYFGTLFIHFGVIFQHPLPAHSRLIAQPLIAIRYGNAMWRPKEFEIWMFKWPNLIWSFAHVGEIAKATVSPREPWRSMKTLLLYRATGTYSAVEYRRWIKPRLGNGFSRWLSAVVAYMPGPFANAVALGYGRLTNRGVHTGLYDLRASRFYFRNLFASKKA